MTITIFQIAEDPKKVYKLLNRLRPELVIPRSEESIVYSFRRKMSRGYSDCLLNVVKDPLQIQLSSDSETRTILRNQIEATLQKNNVAYMVADIEGTTHGRPVNLRGKIKRIEDIFIPDDHPALKIIAKYM